MAKKPQKPYKPPTVRAPRREPVPQNEYQCMWGRGYSSGNMNTTRSHEAGCASKK